MNQRQIGIILIIAGLLTASFVFMAKQREDEHIDIVIQQQGSCYLDDGTCLHDRSTTFFILGFALAAAMTSLGVYLLFDKTQKKLAEMHLEVSGALKTAKETEKQKDEFTAYVSAFRPEEQAVIKAVHEQDGIKQSTLRFRTGMSKASLSVLLKSLQERGIVSKKESGKTNQVYLRKRF